MKKNNNKGFTLAELLIVVAIIAVLVAIAIPVFTSQLEKSREATDLANVRSAYAEQMAAYLTGDNKTAIADINVPVKQTVAGWQCDGDADETTISQGTSTGGITVPAKTTGNYVVKVDKETGVVTVE
ncbi:MAG: prepilin-type N-terminal cleavage/methylation domain-containing protein [Clostridia bacterium]|nr:prepilin-type N-terminal cleavage/methylation domain-containing protein [Clostridia bacterium]